jgi:predicted phosphodiesterase
MSTHNITYGVPWTQEEIKLLKSNINATLSTIHSVLSNAGYSRSFDSIRKKIKRVRAEIKSKDNPVIVPVQTKEIKWVTGSLEINKDRPTKFVMLNDVHVPHNIDLAEIWKFVADYKPDYMLLVGDIVNNDPFDHWAKSSPRRFKTMPQPKEYFNNCNKVFYKPMRAAVGPTCKVVHWVGNHEYWSIKAINDMPEGEGYFEVWNNVEEVDLWVPNKQIANLGHLHFIHGDVIQGGRYHASKMMNYYRRNIRYGHYHDIQESSHTSPIDVTDRHTARSCGTLEKYNPHFMQNRPHDWMQAFTYGVVTPDGYFWDNTVSVVEGRFYAEGKFYG